ncbi:LuxR family transcriptional regulator [Candidatus Magnetomorum sp. HK-1]|nr:LuxR family transcriptional regulator [Candidatus Magnetomorum sp. HK-1]
MNNLNLENKKGIILIIDDNINNIKVLANYLNGNDYITLIAKNGESGIERARFSKPDLILLDIMMPGIDGFETCRRLKKDESTKDIPVLFLTALTETSEKLKGFGVGSGVKP